MDDRRPKEYFNRKPKRISPGKIFLVQIAYPGSKKWGQIMENFHKNQTKSLECHTFFFFKTIKLMLIDIDIYPINN